ncbi:hypothetical protein EVAR_6049_1 [Eumeta japonica]|uniref:Uncharacterized protein n=1 Tax=Eumeta variegata TaxID=151549 RepID=A0A4C1TCC7_EUMVA|nr:hypothetical protein EVAR_6049_1 [Eumeta japonica]
MERDISSHQLDAVAGRSRGRIAGRHDDVGRRGQLVGILGDRCETDVRIRPAPRHYCPGSAIVTLTVSFFPLYENSIKPIPTSGRFIPFVIIPCVGALKRKGALAPRSAPRRGRRDSAVKSVRSTAAASGGPIVCGSAARPDSGRHAGVGAGRWAGGGAQHGAAALSLCSSASIP